MFQKLNHRKFKMKSQTIVKIAIAMVIANLASEFLLNKVAPVKAIVA